MSNGIWKITREHLAPGVSAVRLFPGDTQRWSWGCVVIERNKELHLKLALGKPPVGRHEMQRLLHTLFGEIRGVHWERRQGRGQRDVSFDLSDEPALELAAA